MRGRIAIGSDHTGVEMKERIKEMLRRMGYECEDFGAFDAQPSDYPVFAKKVGEAVASGRCDRGILICGSGIGMSIAANKIPGIRAAACYSTYMARVSRTHNDSNVLVLGARITAVDLALEIVKTWLETEFSGAERHVRRLGLISRMEAEYLKGGGQGV
ncbi:ribose 5-phosphate isomerase B [Candidatus Poribacteria bacterium]|nr:MAG: ribose 5-phosphate isomerase B [Candidatus Poribacteria bacterium]